VYHFTRKNDVAEVPKQLS